MEVSPVRREEDGSHTSCISTGVKIDTAIGLMSLKMERDPFVA